MEWLAREGESRYHHRHPFNVRMHAGALTRDEIRRWARNRYYYQTRIPIKDALILSKSEDSAFRRMWLRRLTDHDGASDAEGGLAQWRRFAEELGVTRTELASHEGVLPGVRFACDAYVSLVRDASLVEAVASSLTEFFAPDLMSRRLEAFERHYPWFNRNALQYFRLRVDRARRDSTEAVDFVVANATSYRAQAACVRALVEKTEILWHLLDCVSRPGGSRP